MNTTKRVEKTVAALKAGHLKEALILTDNREEVADIHAQVVEVANQCLANKEGCKGLMSKAATDINKAIVVDPEAESLDGVAELLTPAPAGEPKAPADVSDPEADALYAECEECHVAGTVVEFAQISEQCTGNSEEITKMLDNPNTTAQEWIKKMREMSENPDACGVDQMKAKLGELEDFLKQRDSPFLKPAEKATEAVAS